MMAGCQVGRSPYSMLAAYNCVLIIADNTNKEIRKNKKTKHITPLYLYNHEF